MFQILNPILFFRLTLLVAALCASFSLRADWINLTGAETAPNIAEIYILDDQVKLVLEIYVANLDLIKSIIPDELLKDEQLNRKSQLQRLRFFSENTFQFVTETGEKLQAHLMLVEQRLRKDRQSLFAGKMNPFTRQPVPNVPSDKRVIYIELSYPFDVKPKELTIVPPMDDEGRSLVSFGFITYHKSIPIIDFRYLGVPAHLTLDWDDPWYSKFDNRNLKRHHKSAMMSYLYIEPYEVRHEVLTRVKDLEAWMDFDLKGDEYIEVDELDDLRQRIGEFLMAKNPLSIDDQLARPILDRTSYVKVGLKGIQLLEKPERLEISTAIVGVIISYITDGIPQKVDVDWQLFTDQVQQVPTSATDPAGPMTSFITPDDNIFNWTNYLKKYEIPTIRRAAVSDTLGAISLPLVSMLCLGLFVIAIWWLWRRRLADEPLRLPLALAAILLVTSVAAYPYFKMSVNRPVMIAGELSPEQATVLLQVLLKNVYRAFDFREEDDVYDKLALSVDGGLLEDIYLQNRKSFSVAKAGGAQAKIKRIDVIEASASRLQSGSLGYAIKARWTALGTVGHWGHLHQRMNQYDAIINVEESNGIWKITGLELLEERRIDPTMKSASSKVSPAEQKTK